MYKQISINLTSPVFSFLLYENNKANYAQEGFLLGDIIFKQTNSITDNDQVQIKSFNTIKINSVIPCPKSMYFYDNVGRIDKEKIKDFLGVQFYKVVAWYKYNRQPETRLSLRDKNVHGQLSKLFEIQTDLFACCLLKMEKSDNLSTYLYQQAFIRWNGYMYDQIPITITNLSNPSNCYVSGQPSSETFSKIIKGLKDVDVKKVQGLTVVNKIHGALQDHIGMLVNDLKEAENELFKLENDVSELVKINREKSSLEVDKVDNKDNESSSPSTKRKPGRGGKVQKKINNNASIASRTRKKFNGK